LAFLKGGGGYVEDKEKDTDETRQDKTRQGKTRQDKTRQDKTRQNKAEGRDKRLEARGNRQDARGRRRQEARSKRQQAGGKNKEEKRQVCLPSLPASFSRTKQSQTGTHTQQHKSQQDKTTIQGGGERSERSEWFLQHASV
jgi:hypothetical protein